MNEFRNEIKWTLAVLVLVGLAVFALWPREPADEPNPNPEPEKRTSAVTQDQRDAAELEACRPGEGSPRGDLAGTEATCLADGESVDLGAMVGDGPTLINVWATWCAPCRAELPALQQYAQRPDGIPVVGVQVDSDQAGGLDLLRELGVHFPVVHDGENRVRAALNAPNVVPTSYVVTSDGRVKRVEPPTPFATPDEVGAAVQRTLGEAGAEGG